MNGPRIHDTVPQRTDLGLDRPSLRVRVRVTPRERDLYYIQLVISSLL